MKNCAHEMTDSKEKSLEHVLTEWKQACAVGKGSEWLYAQPKEIQDMVENTEDYQTWLELQAEKADAHNCSEHLEQYDTEHDVCTVCGQLFLRHYRRQNLGNREEWEDYYYDFD